MVQRLRITDARVPLCLVEGEFADAGEGLARVDIEIADRRIAGLRPAAAEVNPGSATVPDGAARIDQDGGQVWPGFVDCHTHLDKGQTWPRAPNPDGSFGAAVEAVRADRTNWSAEDLRRRFDFGLRCAFAHGTVAIRTHLDCARPLWRTNWEVFAELREDWAERITLQAVSLAALEDLQDGFGDALADLVASERGVLGAATYMHPAIDRQLDRLFALADARGLDLDLHVDESLDPMARSLRHIAEAALRQRFAGKIVCGHCCSLAVQAPDEALCTLDLVAQAGIAVVSLPMCNLYLQDRAPGRTPRRRGVTLLHEMAARGIPVAIASDNCRDPFFAYGDLDLLEVFREAVRIAQLDCPVGAWPAAVTRTPARTLCLPDAGVVRVGAAADLVLFRARHYSELLSRPQADRIVLRAGQPIDTTLPDYRELDHLFEAALRV
ncbi:MAG TPA: cytosine deaminase [Geminicoccaceae bacterium]|nr:cytosine deaminase [Geminicoccaceae bacterium]